MPKKVPCVRGRDAVRAFCRLGFSLDHIAGSHHILFNPTTNVTISIPVHAGKTVGRGLLKSQLDAAGLTVEQFCNEL